MLNDIRSDYPVLADYDSNKLDEFRKTRNRITHFGFSPKDDEKCAALLLEVGLPFLDLCYREFFDFYLDWQDIDSAVNEFHKLSADQMAKAGLMPDLAKQLRFLKIIYQRARRLENANYVKSFAPLGHFISWGVKIAARTKFEWKMIETDPTGLKWEIDEQAKNNLERLFDPSWVFNCPICGRFDSLVAELDFSSRDVVTDRCACVECGFFVGKGAPYISQVVLDDEIVEKRATILREYGMEPDIGK
jgi:hypothetical protein